MLVFAHVTIHGASLTIPWPPGVAGAGYLRSCTGGCATSSDTLPRGAEAPGPEFPPAGHPKPCLSKVIAKATTITSFSLVTIVSEPQCSQFPSPAFPQAKGTLPPGEKGPRRDGDAPNNIESLWSSKALNQKH